MDERYGEITALKSLLSDTDHEIIKIAEGLFACDTVTELMGKLKSLSQEVRDIIAKRAEWRAKINALEEEMDEEETEGG